MMAFSLPPLQQVLWIYFYLILGSLLLMQPRKNKSYMEIKYLISVVDSGVRNPIFFIFYF